MKLDLNTGTIGLILAVLGYLFLMAKTIVVMQNNQRAIAKSLESLKDKVDTLNVAREDHSTRLAIIEDRRIEYRRTEDRELHGT